MQTLSSASRTCMASASAVECTATVENAELFAGAQHTQCDLAAIGDEDFCRTSLDNHQRFAVLDRLAILDKDLRDGA